jgi:hypothetical protein
MRILGLKQSVELQFLYGNYTCLLAASLQQSVLSTGALNASICFCIQLYDNMDIDEDFFVEHVTNPERQLLVSTFFSDRCLKTSIDT